MSTADPGAALPVLRTGSRVAAAAALVVAVGHVPMALGELRVAPVLAALSVLLCLACGHCARSLWRRPTQRAWQLAVVMAAGMLALTALMPSAHAAVASPGVASTAHATAGMPGMSGMPGMPGVPGTAGTAGGAGARGVAGGAVAAALEGPVATGTRWLLLLLGGWALVRCRTRPRRALPAPPA